MTTEPEWVAGLLLQSMSEDREGALSGFRIYADGRRERKLKSGGGWVPEPPLSPTQLDAVRSALAAPEVRAVAPSHRAARRPDDAGARWLQLAEGEGHRTIYWETGCTVDALTALYAAIAKAIGAVPAP